MRTVPCIFRPAVLFLAGLATAGAALAQPGEGEPSALNLQFEPAAVVVTGATPAARIAIFGVAREPKGVFQRVVRYRDLVFADDLGEARFELEGSSVPLKSVWAIADLDSGSYTVGAPSGFPLRRLEFPGRGFEAGAPGLVDHLEHHFPWVDMLVVRPGVGAWSLHTWDTGPADRDGLDDDRTVTSLEDLEPLGTSPSPPERYGKDDVVVVVSPRDLRFYATRLVGAPTEGGAR